MKQMIKFLAMFAQGLAATVSLIATGADAQNARNCAPRDQVVTRLAEGYGETRQSIGLGANNSVIEVFASDESSTWTITMTAPNGITCLIASGQAFEMLPNPCPSTATTLEADACFKRARRIDMCLVHDL